MGYVGNQQTEGFSQVPAKQDLTGATGTSLTLTHAVASAEGIDLFINNVRQEPTTAYSVGGDGVTVTLTGSVVATDDIYVVYNSLARQTSTHPSNQALQATSGTFSGTVTASSVGVGAAPNATFGSLLYTQGTPAVNKPIVSAYSQGNSNNAGFALFNDAGNRGIWTTGSTMRFTRTYEGNSTADLTIDASGNVGIGGSPASKLNVISATSGGISIAQGTENFYGASAHRFFTDGYASEVMRIDSSGNAMVNTTGSIGGAKFSVEHPTDCMGLNLGPNATSSRFFMFFTFNGINVGAIKGTSSATSYLTSSDYRLKENVTATWDATTRLKQLNPVRFNFIADADTTVDGFLAHEVQDIVPEAISGTHNGMRDEEYEVTPAVLDEDGNEVTPAVMGTRSVPDYQGIDQSKLVPLLVKTIQELEARIAALENV